MTTFLGAIGVPHYTKDGKLYTGAMHKDGSGRLMTGKFHTANSQFLFHDKNGVDGIKGVPLSKDLGKQIELLKKHKARLDKAIRENKGEDIIKANQYAFMRKLQDVQRLSKEL